MSKADGESVNLALFGNGQPQDDDYDWPHDLMKWIDAKLEQDTQ
jgi:hypothetical protein